MFTPTLPPTRPFPRRTYFILVALYVLGNLAGIPLLRRTGAPVEPVWLWAVATAVAALIIALGLLLACRTGLGAPLLEGRLPRENLSGWLRNGLALTLLILIAGPLSLLVNLDVDPAAYPFGWELLFAAFKAGVVEEIGYRLFVVALLVWLGSRFRRDAAGRPARAVYWTAVVLAGLLFGWAHVAAGLDNPNAPLWGLVLLMLLASGLGIAFGWLFWQLGLEWAIIAHFAYDSFISLIVIPVYLLRSPAGWLALAVGLALAACASWRLLTVPKNPVSSEKPGF